MDLVRENVMGGGVIVNNYWRVGRVGEEKKVYFSFVGSSRGDDGMVRFSGRGVLWGGCVVS